ncbi:MAG TPA: FtsX-like permease family protein [Alphaproteobacteria bacterium]|nr:FtsX-like permease family protein [Alphaproteobacteria bacterium]
MNHLTISLSYLKARAPESLLQVLLLAIGLGTVVFVILFESQFTERMTSNAKPFDLVVGAKGSALQLVLSTVYQADVPTGNIPLPEAQALREDPGVAVAIPMALGDSYDGFRIVGTEPDYSAQYGAKLNSGRFWTIPLEAVLGATVAKRSRLRIGDSFVGIHGVFGGGDEHKDTPYRVVGILGETGTLIDRLVLTSVESVWRVHEVQYAHAKSMIFGGSSEASPEGDGSVGNSLREVTAMLIRLKSPASLDRLEQYVDRRPTLQWASPQQEATRFLAFVGAGGDMLRVMAGVFIAMSALGVCTALFNAMRKRRYDFAIMRALGASPAGLLWLVLVEGVIVAFSAAVIGIMLGHAGAGLIGKLVPEAGAMALDGSTLAEAEIYIPLLALGACLLGALLPAVLAYRIEVAEVLLRRKP